MPKLVGRFSGGGDEWGRVRSGLAIAALDITSKRNCRNTVRLGSADLTRRWAMLSENRAPRYAASWSCREL
ncbi:DUF4113 domain-containing protein [Janthinobacterium sp. P210005]|uniref:DUF4113 domain-containing protein n=1 Tax=Janthinobacterium sp. P210005 TaxID=3112938 RepID=UPI003FA5F8A0